MSPRQYLFLATFAVFGTQATVAQAPPDPAASTSAPSAPATAPAPPPSPAPQTPTSMPSVLPSVPTYGGGLWDRGYLTGD